MAEQNHSQFEIQKIIRFFRTKHSKYIFIVLEDDRFLNDILTPVIDTFEKEGKDILHFSLNYNDYYVFQQINRKAYYPGLQGLIVSGLNELIEKFGETFIDNLNRSRDAFQRMEIPIAWVIAPNNLKRIIRGASDFYQLRALPDFHFKGTPQNSHPLIDINFFFYPHFEVKINNTNYLEKQLASIPRKLKYDKDTINRLVLPLLHYYIQQEDIEKMKSLHHSYLKGREEIINEPYILIAYYTAIKEPDKGPFFPKHLIQPIFPSAPLLPNDKGHLENLFNIIMEKKGLIVLSAEDSPIKYNLISHTLNQLKNHSYDFIVIYGTISPELILYHIALKAKEYDDQNALKVFSGTNEIEAKIDYYIQRFLSNHKIVIIAMHFEENQSEELTGRCKSTRLKLFLSRICERLKGKESFLFLSSCFPIPGFTHYTIPGNEDAVLTPPKIEALPKSNRKILEVLSLFNKPVYPGLLRFYDINPENHQIFKSLEELSLLEIIHFPKNENEENIRLYVPFTVSRLLQKKMDITLKKEFHISAGWYYNNFLADKKYAYIESIIEARRHYIEAEEWEDAANLTLQIFSPLHSQNFLQWAMELLMELEIETLPQSSAYSKYLKYQVHRRLGLLHYYRGAYFYSWENYKAALELVTDTEERYRLYSEILPIELSINPDFISTYPSVFKGIFHTLPEKLPMEIIKQGPQSIINYFNEIKNESVLFLESKLLLVGNGEVGKTTLMKKLKNNEFVVLPGTEDTTRGIDIQPWELSCTFPNGDSHSVKVHFWDFGGQDILHATHQFFLTKRSLYIFVWDPKKEDQTRSFDYWLNVVKLFGDQSPIIVVMNKSELRIKEIDEASFKDKFPTISQFIQVSCVTNHNIPQLIELIRTAFSRMPHLLDKFSKRWLDIRDRLNAIDENYITLNRYLDICWEFNMDEENAHYLSDYLHDLGITLHFRTDPVLVDTVILKPQWATGALYALIDSLEIQKNKGRFNRSDLTRYWDTQTYPIDKHAQLLRLMEKF